jgi:hypothetical protein
LWSKRATHRLGVAPSQRTVETSCITPVFRPCGLSACVFSVQIIIDLIKQQLAFLQPAARHQRNQQAITGNQ